MSQWGWVLLGWSVVIGALALYGASLLVRGRRLAVRVAPGRRRWMSADDEPTEAGHGEGRR